MRKHGYGVALYPPPEVGGFTATEDKPISRVDFAADGSLDMMLLQSLIDSHHGRLTF